MNRSNEAWMTSRALDTEAKVERGRAGAPSLRAE